MRRSGIVVVGLVLLAACSSGGSDAAPSPSTTRADRAATGASGTVPAAPSAGCGRSTVAAGETEETLTSGDETRTYFRHVPPAHDGRRPVPLVLDFHGYSEGASIHRQMSDLGSYGDAEGFVTVTPQGLGAVARWDTTLGSHDLVFVGALMDAVEADLCIDTNRVYSTGLSNGAFLTSAIACEYGDRVAAVAPVAGVRTIDGCEFDRPVPIVAFHGTADGFVDYDGGLGEQALDLPAPDGSGGTLRDTVDAEQIERSVDSSQSIPAIMAAWADRNGCGAKSRDRAVTDDVTELAWDCPADAATELYRVTDGGHAWPGSETSQRLDGILGHTTMTIDANEIMWRFFVAHPLPAAS